jgi:hypothetical protein
VGYNPNEPRDASGRWGSGAVAFVKGQLTTENAQLAVVLAVRKGLYLFGQFDDPMMEVVEPMIHDAVHNGATHARVAASVAREAMRNAARKMRGH